MRARSNSAAGPERLRLPSRPYSSRFLLPALLVVGLATSPSWLGAGQLAPIRHSDGMVHIASDGVVSTERARGLARLVRRAYLFDLQHLGWRMQIAMARPLLVQALSMPLLRVHGWDGFLGAALGPDEFVL